MTYALDTNTIIAILGNNKNVEEKGDIAIMAGNKLIIPPLPWIMKFSEDYVTSPRPKKRKSTFHYADTMVLV